MFLSAVWTLILTDKQTHLHFGWPEDEYISSKCSTPFKESFAVYK